MTKPIARDPIYRRRRFDAEIIELCVRWYITSRLSYRDLAAMMAERGVIVSHTSIHRWVIRYVPEFEKRWNRFARPVNTSWRVDETYINIRGKWNFLYRAVDKLGKTVDFLLRPDRSIAAGQAFFRKALSTSLPRWPRKITLDGHKQSHLALRLLRLEDPKWKYVQVRSSQLLSANIESRTDGRERVLVMQPAKDRFGADGVRFRAAVTRTGFSEVEDTWWWIRNTRAQRHVRTSGIVVSNPGFQNGPQMRFGNGDQPIQALAPNLADDSFTDRIRFRAARRRFQHLNAKSIHRFVEVLGKDAIAIMQ